MEFIFLRRLARVKVDNSKETFIGDFYFVVVHISAKVPC
jgi:hypothetical protein